MGRSSDFVVNIDGGDGDDSITLGAGYLGMVDGGAGNDQIIIANAAGFDITTGEGADLVALGPELRDSLPPVTLTDFNPEEDTLVLALGVKAPDEVALAIFQNIAENRTEVRATVPAVEAETVTEFGVLLYVDGAPEISVQDIVIVNSLPAPVAA